MALQPPDQVRGHQHGHAEHHQQPGQVGRRYGVEEREDAVCDAAGVLGRGQDGQAGVEHGQREVDDILARLGDCHPSQADVGDAPPDIVDLLGHGVHRVDLDVLAQIGRDEAYQFHFEAAVGTVLVDHERWQHPGGHRQRAPRGRLFRCSVAQADRVGICGFGPTRDRREVGLDPLLGVVPDVGRVPAVLHHGDVLGGDVLQGYDHLLEEPAH